MNFKLKLILGVVLLAVAAGGCSAYDYRGQGDAKRYSPGDSYYNEDYGVGSESWKS